MIAALAAHDRRTAIMFLCLCGFYALVLLGGSFWAEMRDEQGLSEFLRYMASPLVVICGVIVTNLWLM